MKQILVPIDFSEASLNAAKYAAELARVDNTNILLLNVVSQAVISDESVLAPILQTQEEKVNENKRRLQRDVNFLSLEYSSEIAGRVTTGLPVDVIFEIARMHNTDLIVAGMKGRGKSNSIFGSVATAMIRRRELPVLLIPERARFQEWKNITVATDFDADMEMNRYELLWELAEKFSSRINILNVEKSDTSMSQSEIIGKVLTETAFSKLDHQFHEVRQRNITRGILSFINENPTDLLVMIEHKHNLFERIFAKEHIKEMSYETRVPLLVLPESFTT